ncbi:hypothetical protein [Caldithrix abyssi]
MARKKIYLMVLCLLSNFLLSRCAMVGLGIGLVMQKNETLEIKPEDQDSGFLLAGQKLQFVLQNDSLINGKLRAVEMLPREIYGKTYNRFLSKQPAENRLPALNDTLTLIYRSKLRERALFEGWDKSGMWIRLPVSGKTLRFPYRQIFVMRWNEFQWSGDSLPGLLTKWQVPLRSELKVEIKNGRILRIAWNDIRRIYYRKKSHYALTGFLIGFTIDSIILFKILSTPLVTNINLGPM